MGLIGNNIKVTLDNELARDKPFHFYVLTDGTEADMESTVNAALTQKKREGELTDEDIQQARSVKVTSNDKQGYFASYVFDIKNFFKRL